MHGEVCGFERTVEELEAVGIEATIAVRRTEPLGPLIAARREALAARGLLTAERREEDIAVVWGRLPGGANAPEEGHGGVRGAVGVAPVDVLGPGE